MDIIGIVLLIIIVFISIKELMKSKKNANDNVYGIYQNSKFYRLLIVVIVSIFVIIMFILKKIIY